MKRKSNIEEIEMRIVTAKAEVETAQASISALEAARTTAIRTGTDAEIDAAEDRLRLAKRAIERGNAKLDTAAADLEAENARLAAQDQKEQETKAEAAAHKASELLRATFETLGPAIHQALRAKAEADILVERANKGRSVESEPLLDVEARCRLQAPIPRKIISEVRMQEWVFASTGQRIGPEREAEVVSRDGLSGSLPGGTLSNGTKVVKQEFLKRTFLPAVRHSSPSDLASTLDIPALKAGDPPIWSPLSYSTPEAVLAALDKLIDAVPAEASRQPEVEFVPVARAAAA